MKTHQDIDQRSLAMARAIVARIDADPHRAGLTRAKDLCQRWYRERNAPVDREWLDILEQPWGQVREVLLDESETGRRLRQSTPFCGILTPRERWAFYKTRSNRET